MKRFFQSLLLILFFLPTSINLPILYSILLLFALTLLDRKMFVSELSKLFLWTSVYIVFRELFFWKSFTGLSVFDLAALRFLILAVLSLFVFTVLVQSNFEFSYRLRKVLFILITLNVFGYLTGISYNSPIEGEGRAFLWPTTVIVYLSFFYLEKRKFISSLIMFTSVLITQSRALYLVLSIFISKLLFKKGGVLFFLLIFLFVSLNSEFLFQRFVNNSVKEDARNIEINALLYKIKLEPYILLVGQPFSVQIWDGMLEEGGIMDSDLAWAIYNKYDVHNYFLVSIFRLGLPLTVLWIIAIFKVIKEHRLRVAFVILGMTSNAFLTNPEALSGYFIAKKIKD